MRTAKITASVCMAAALALGGLSVARAESESASAVGAPRVVFLWYADGGSAPSSSLGCGTAGAPKFACNYGASPEECQRKVQAYLDKWYADFNVVFTFKRPASGRFDTVVIASQHWCPSAPGQGTAPWNDCQPYAAGTCYAFACGSSAKLCARIIAQEQAHLVGLAHTNSATDIMNGNSGTIGATTGFDNKAQSANPGCLASQNSYELMKTRIGAWPGGPKPDPWTGVIPTAGPVAGGAADAGAGDAGGGDSPDALAPGIDGGPGEQGGAGGSGGAGGPGPGASAPGGSDGNARGGQVQGGCNAAGRPMPRYLLLAVAGLALLLNRRAGRTARRGLPFLIVAAAAGWPTGRQPEIDGDRDATPVELDGAVGGELQLSLDERPAMPIAAAAGSDNWPTFGHDGQRTFASEGCIPGELKAAPFMRAILRP